MAIQSMDDLVGAFPGQFENYFKVTATSKVAGSFHSLWRTSGVPSNGSIPPVGAGEIPTKEDSASFTFNNPAVGNTLYLGKASLIGSTVGTVILYDRLFHNSGLDGTSTVAQEFTMPALTRYTDGSDVEVWLEIYAALGSTAKAFTFSYTNKDDVKGRIGNSVINITSTCAVGQMFPTTLQAGDTGIKSVESVTLAGSTGTVGNFGVTILRRIIEMPITIINIATVQDAITLGLPVIQPNACLATMVVTSTTNTGTMQGHVRFIEG